MNSQFRKPNRYAEPIPPRRQKKWDKIINAFMEGRFDELEKIQRTGTRGRIFEVLIKDMLKIFQMPSESEPIFNHIAPNKWYLDFASKHDLKIRTNDFYNPDYLLSDGTWLEITLSENTAYKKLFKYGHQTSALKVLWLDEDEGLHKKVCKDTVFPNARVESVETYFPMLKTFLNGNELIDKLYQLKSLKQIIK